MEKDLQAFSCQPGWNSETSYLMNQPPTSYLIEKVFLNFPYFIDTYYLGMCSDELESVIPPKAYFGSSTHFADSQHPFTVKSEKCWITSFANTFVAMTSRNWNSQLSNLQNPGAQTYTPPPFSWSIPPLQ